MPPPPFLDLTRRIPEALVATPRERLFDQYDPRYSVGVAEEDSKIKESIAADVALRRCVCGETNGNTSKAERDLYYDDDQRRVVSSSTQYVPPLFIERQRERLSLAHVNHPQSPTPVSMTDRRRMPSSTYKRGVQW